jgi:hypothetical protein
MRGDGVTHYRIVIVDSHTGSVQHENSNTVFRNIEQADNSTEKVARDMAALMITPNRKVTVEREVDPDQWLIGWVDDAGQTRSRVVSMVASDEPLDLRAADMGADSA